MVVCVALVLVLWPLVCFQVASMAATTIRQIDEGNEDGTAGAGPLLRFFIRWRWWVSYAGAAP